MRWILFPAFCCMAALLAAQSRPVAGSPDWLVGTWVPDSESCESDAGVTYERNGTWSGYGTAGRWTLADGTVKSEVTERWEDGSEVRKLNAPEKYAAKIEVLGPDKYVSHLEDGTVVRLSRCPPGSN